MTHTNNKIWTLSFVFVVISNSLVFMIFEMLLPTLPLFVTEIGGGASQVGLVTGIFTLSAILTRPFAGLLASKIDKKFLLVLGILINAFATGAYYLSSDISTLLIIRLMHGAGFGLVTTYFATLAAEIVPKERRGEGIGYFGVGETVAISVGPMLGIMTLELYDFQRLFLGGMAVLLLAVVMGVFVKRAPEGKKLDKQSNVKVKIMERRVFYPAILIFLVGIAAGGIMSFFSLYAIEKDFSQVGLFFFVIALASFIIRLISGKLFDLFGPTIILIPGSIFSIIGLSILYAANSDFTFFMAATFYGFGFGALLPAIQTWCINLVGEHEHEDAMATFFNFFDFGIGGGSLLLGLVAAATSYQAIYIVTILVYILFFMMYVVYLIVKKQQQPKELGGLYGERKNQASSH
ncbi:MFS transporter [Salipaludibacillus agaradhaerens]|uniref:MFS transporter n=1 Tax=Salipaludibacillus agaradhaerens TaxID=76935 RepID=A0A9Q4FZ33_SALAG|nr:MFS transporter [Salipaludibacillus agaradhaerens]MCR6096378.1 MFS transporter [Salipaludibacillus agaradhaerens]MCR6114063.1 MFS transporter [Salipaludibacillus agaradhaerens]